MTAPVPATEPEENTVSAMTLRLDGDVAERLRITAEALGQSQAQFVREAIDRYCQFRLSQPHMLAPVCASCGREVDHDESGWRHVTTPVWLAEASRG